MTAEHGVVTDVEPTTEPTTEPVAPDQAETDPETTDLGATLRALRRAADLSQRELAARSGVPQTTLARIECGRSVGPSFRTVERLVAAAGGRVTIRSLPAGRQEQPLVGRAGPSAVSQERLRDAAGRHCPAHLDAREVREPKDWPGAWWAQWPGLSAGYWSVLPAVTYRLDRERRDRDRIRERVRRGFRVRRDLDPEVPTTSWRFVAELPDGELVGELRAHERSIELLLGFPLPGWDEIVLDGVLFTPACRRLGIGRRLVAALAAEMARCGVRSALGVAEGEGACFLGSCGFGVEPMKAAVMRFDPPVSGAPQRRW
ncbi:GNAT family N-acetyltransferase [Micromonospora humi]|uniref:Acetyltransferase (GNAT) family protein n=1 Tax=Micromonospora humi TaxID=745366 RepID=A0A1C5ILX2_9ACTN|nr:GNAT family N-acetyltransferase [Micromonospora humi]SCG58796.1 Acetyltransferase (GNAT) family protein [Micromonospora humi]